MGYTWKSGPRSKSRFMFLLQCIHLIQLARVSHCIDASSPNNFYDILMPYPHWHWLMGKQACVWRSRVTKALLKLASWQSSDLIKGILQLKFASWQWYFSCYGIATSSSTPCPTCEPSLDSDERPCHADALSWPAAKGKDDCKLCCEPWLHVGRDQWGVGCMLTCLG